MRHEIIGEVEGHRLTLLRMVAMYVPLTALAGGVSLISLSAVLGGTYEALIPLTILLLVTLATLLQAVAALRDLRAVPAFTRGEVSRLWTKGGFLWFFRSHYVMVNRQVFVLRPDIWIQIADGNTIECHHWPHTRTVIRVVLLSGDLDELVPGKAVAPLPEALT